MKPKVATPPTAGTRLRGYSGSPPIPIAPGVGHDDGMLTFILWLLLLAIAWPLALLAVLLYPLVWLLSLPFRLLGISVKGVFSLLSAIITLPARVLERR